MNKSDYLANQQLNAALRGVSFTPASTHYIGLFTTTPTASGGGVEVATGAYQRKAVTFGAPVSRQSSNTGSVNFDVPTLDWGKLMGAALFDALTGGNLLYFGDLVTPRDVFAGDPVFFPVGYFVITE
jgi:hypothetical protein